MPYSCSSQNYLFIKTQGNSACRSGLIGLPSPLVSLLQSLSDTSPEIAESVSMSTDYFLFVQSHEFPEVDLPLLAKIDGVELADADQLSIDGFSHTYCKTMDMYHRELMMHDYGKYSQRYTWYLRGTYDNKTCLNQLMQRLVQCAATLVAARPWLPLALMREAEFFYVFNSPSTLILSQACFDEEGNVPAPFKKRYSKRDIHSY